MINCRYASQSLIFRSNHKFLSLLKPPTNPLKDANVDQKSTQSNNVNLPGKSSKQTQCKDELHFKKWSVRQLRLINESTAEKIAKYLIDSPNKDTPIVEANPGKGVLTGILLRSRLKHLHLFEGNKEFITYLEDAFSNVYPHIVTLKNADLITLGTVRFIDSVHGTKRMDDILANLPITEWQNDINFRLFAITEKSNFLFELLTSIVRQDGILGLGRCEMYIVLPPPLYLILTSSAKATPFYYRSISILFQIFFEYELLDKFSKTDFVPTIKHYSKITRRFELLKKTDPDSMYFVKIIPRRDLYEFFTDIQIQEFWHFVKRSYQRRKSFIIPYLENIIPKCGSHLILSCCTKARVRPKPIKTNNSYQIPPFTNPAMTLSKEDFYDKLNVFTRFSDLQPTELMTLFWEIRNLPDYMGSNFVSSMELDILRTELKKAKGNRFGIDDETNKCISK